MTTGQPTAGRVPSDPPSLALARDPDVAALLPEARRTIERVARTFAMAARLLPRQQREDVELLYLVLRTLDDLVDLEAERPDDPVVVRRLEAVEAWAVTRAPGEGNQAGSPGDGTSAAAPGFSTTPLAPQGSTIVAAPEVSILTDLARRHPGLPRDAVADFTEGMRQDLAGPIMATEADLDAYCYRVAGTVGRLMAAILGARGPEADRAARALGIAMQRTNILRDIDEDLARGRCYLPAETLLRHGIADADALRIADRRSLLRDEIALADADYERGLAGIGALRHGERSVRAAALMYREILRQIERDGLGARRPHRAVVPRWRKLVLLARATLRRA